jgi:hypothetical protein
MTSSATQNRARTERGLLGSLPLSIEEGARVFQSLGLRAATLREFLGALQRQEGPARLSAALTASSNRVDELVRLAKQLAAKPGARATAARTLAVERLPAGGAAEPRIEM